MRLRALAARSSSASREQLPCAEVIRCYDAPETLFYLDPPYLGCEEDYGAGFERLAELVEGIAGRFILSINDTPATREVFGQFAMEEVQTTYTIATATIGAGRRVGELVIASR